MAHAFVDSYRRHMAKEETDFFPEALRALTPQEWAEIENRITNPTDPVFESRVAERELNFVECEIEAARAVES